MTEPTKLDAYDFSVCLLAAVARRGDTDFVHPFSDRRHATDAGAHMAWMYLESQFSDAFVCTFAIYNTGWGGRSEDWSFAISSCEQRGMIDKESKTSRTGFALVASTLQEEALKICDDELPWDILADVYIEARDAA